MNGIPTQTLAAITDTFAQVGSPSHAGPSMPSARSNWSKNPFGTL